MNDAMKSKVDQMIGGIKETVGKAVESEELELKGKLQKTIGETKEKAAELGKEATEKLAGKANDLIDKFRDEKKF